LADRVEISNLNITGGTSAVLITDGSSATITNNQMLDYTGDGIFIAGSSGGSIQDNFLSSTIANRSAIFVVGSANALIDDNTIGASSGSGILIAATSNALVGCNDISVSHPFFGGIHVNQTAQLSLGACPNTISNSNPVGRAIFCGQTSSIFAEAAQIITAGAIDLHPNCEVLANPGVTFPPLPLSKTLVLVIDFANVIFNAGSTNTLAKGVRTYQEFPLLDAQGAVIGEYRFHAVSTLPAGDGAAWYGNESFEIFGEGVIEGISQADMSVTLFPEGSIIGGTGRFSGASGEYTASNFSTYTFTFKIAR
jgi:parallel beta-helix repeat protein